MDEDGKKGGAPADLVKVESLLQVAIALPGGCLIGWLLGHWADGHFHQNWIGIVGVVLGAVGGFVQIITTAQRFMKNSR